VHNISGISVPLEKLIKEIETITGKKPKKVNTGKMVLCGDCEKARTDLGFKETPLEVAIKDSFSNT
jgi:nucleoside-diphosphate-sugar epimerase